MNREQIEKHGEVIKWYIDNPDKGVWRKQCNELHWSLLDNPMFFPEDIYVQNDEYAELRKAQVDGIELWQPEEGEWCVYRVFEGAVAGDSYKVKRYTKQLIDVEVYPLEFIQTLKEKQ